MSRFLTNLEKLAAPLSGTYDEGFAVGRFAFGVSLPYLEAEQQSSSELER